MDPKNDGKEGTKDETTHCRRVDEKFFIDGERFPSWFGTGTEDYFGYAWCDPTLFSHAYHAQSYNKGGVNEEGSKVLCRYQITDNIMVGLDYLKFEAAQK